MQQIGAEVASRMPKSRRMPMLEGFLYEPRAFWSFGRFASSQPGTARPPNVIRLNREHFYNGEKYPVTLLYVCIAPLNYIFDQYAEAGQPPSEANFRNCNAAQYGWAQLRIASRQRQHYIRVPSGLQSLTPHPTWEPAAREEPTSAIADGASSLFNVYGWELDAPMIIPARGDLEYFLSTWSLPGFDDQSATVTAEILTTEVGNGPFGGNARTSGRFFLQPQFNTPQLYPSDGFGAPVPAQGALGIWTPQQAFTAQAFAAQNKTSDGSIPITSFAAMIDQRAYDTRVVAQASPNATLARVAPLGFRVGTRARMRHGGTGAFFWREGAPLALVSPTRTPAQVFELYRPITLGPGDSLEVDLIFPEQLTINDVNHNAVNQVAVSFCGHAAIAA